MTEIMTVVQALLAVQNEQQVCAHETQSLQAASQGQRCSEQETKLTTPAAQQRRHLHAVQVDVSTPVMSAGKRPLRCVP